MIDWIAWCAQVRHTRRAAGYVRAQDFAAVVAAKYGVGLTKHILYNIESGKQRPDVEQFLAINEELFGEPIPGIFY